MSNKNFIVSFVLVVLMLFVFGCAKAPQQDVDAANVAVQAAKDAEADRYLPDEFKAAQDSLNAAITEIETQNSKFALTRKYDKAKKSLAAATAMANDLNAKIAARKEEVKAEAQQLMVDLQTALTDAKKLMKKAPKGKEGREALQAMENELMVVETSIGEVNTLMENGDFMGAKDKLAAGKQKVDSIIEELNMAIEKVKKGR